MTTHDTPEAATLYGVTIPVDKDGSCLECNAPAGVDRVPRCTHWLDALLLLEHNRAARITHDTPEAALAAAINRHGNHGSGSCDARCAVAILATLYGWRLVPDAADAPRCDFDCDACKAVPE
jgi:hypothetical protein